MEQDHNFDRVTVDQVAHIQYIWCPKKQKAMKGPIVAIESVCSRVQHKYCTAIHLGQFQ